MSSETKKLGLYIGISFSDKVKTVLYNGVRGISVKGIEPLYYPDGDPVEVEYVVESVVEHPTETNSILIKVSDSTSFRNATSLTVSYNRDEGVLAGDGGSVESFDLTFNPSDLEYIPHQGIPISVNITNVTAKGTFIDLDTRVIEPNAIISIRNVVATGIITKVTDI